MRRAFAFLVSFGFLAGGVLRSDVSFAAPEEPLRLNAVISGTCNAPLDYAFDAPGPGVLSVTAWGTGTSGDLVLEVLDAQGNPLDRSDQDLGGEPTREFLTVPIAAAGRWVVRVEPFGSGERNATTFGLVAHWVDAPPPAEGAAASEAEARAFLESVVARFHAAESFRCRVEGSVPGEMSLTGSGAWRGGRFRGELALGSPRGSRDEQFTVAWDGRTLFAEERRGADRRDVDRAEPPGGEMTGIWLASCDEDVAMPAMMVFPHLLLEALMDANAFTLSSTGSSDATVVYARPRAGASRHEDVAQMTYRVSFVVAEQSLQISWSRGREALTSRHWVEWDAAVGDADLAYEPPAEEDGGGSGSGGTSPSEAAAIGCLRTLSVAQSVFRESDRDGDGVLDYGTLAELAAAQLIDPELGSGRKSGYVFDVIRAEEFRWAARANPERPGGAYFYIDESGVIRSSSGSPADENSPPLR